MDVGSKTSPYQKCSQKVCVLSYEEVKTFPSAYKMYIEAVMTVCTIGCVCGGVGVWWWWWCVQGTIDKPTGDASRSAYQKLASFL
jgi:hypothetical protein